MNRMSYRGGQGGQTVIPGGPLGKARYALALGRPDEAERICRKRLERQPDDAATRILLSQALLQMRLAKEAVEEARKATRAAPTNPDAHLALSAALLQTGRFSVPEEARTAAERAVQLSPKLARARVQLAEVYASDNKNAQAVATADEAIKLEPRNPSGYFIKALVLVRDKRYDEAVAAAESAIRFDRDKQLPQAEFVKANALVEVKRYDEALAALAAAEKANALLGGAQADSLRGRIFFKQRKFRDSYQANLEAQRKSGRGGWFAPALAGINMVFVGLFGERGPYFLLGTVMFIALMIIYLVSLIPVAGQWAASGLVVLVLLVLALASVQQLQGSILPADRSQWVTTLPAMVAGFILAAGATIAIERLISTLFTAHPPLFTPITLGIAGAVGAVAAAFAAWGWPRLLQRYGGGRAAAA